jgi:glycosyltransferase involved in cell wall biosynthesis
MTAAMADQIRIVSGVRAHVIGNFVDESALDCHRRAGARAPGALRFVFVGSLTRRKQPELVIEAVKMLAEHDVQLDVIGDGPLREAIEASLVSRQLHHRVRLHGQLANPYPILASADVFVLPSRSEGVSRAALEALHLGVPCVLRNVDGNADLLGVPGAGTLFIRDQDLAQSMMEAAGYIRHQPTRNSLLPPSFRQATAAAQYLALLDQTA